MAFIASQSQTAFVPTGAGQVTVPVPRYGDASGNGRTQPMFSHFMLTSASTTGGAGKVTFGGSGAIFAIKPDQSSIVVQQDAASIIAVLFGKAN